MRISWTRAIVAGIIGTLLFDITGFLGTLLLGDPSWWDIPALLADKLGLPFAVGVFAHFLNGSVIAVLYSAVAPSLWGSAWARALLFITAQTVLGVWLFMAPLLGMGVAGWAAMGPVFAILSLVRHWAYAIPLALLVPSGQEQEVTLAPAVAVA
jgi:hypothetical protein